MMTTSDEIEVFHGRFNRRERSGVFLGLTWPQIAIVSSVAIIIVILVLTAQTFLLFILGIPLIGFAITAVLRYRREPVIFYLLYTYRFFRAKAIKQSTYKGGPRTYKKGELNLPGALANLHIYETASGFCFTYDTSTTMFTFTLTCDAPARDLQDEGTKNRSAAGFVAWANGLSRISALQVCDVRMRSDFADEQGVQHYTETKIVENGFDIEHDFAARQAFEAAKHASRTSMKFTYEITYGLSMKHLKAARFNERINRAGGGLPGAAEVLAMEAEMLIRSMSRCGIENVRVLSESELLWSARRAFDPFTTLVKQKTFQHRSDVVIENVKPVAMKTFWDKIQIDAAFHQTFWIGEWPMSDVPIGFLGSLVVDGGDFVRNVCLSLKPIDVEKAMKRVEAARSDQDEAELMRSRMGQLTTRAQEAEAQDLEARATDLSEGYRELELRGYVTISARTLEELDIARNALEIAAAEALVELKLLYFQQREAHFTSTLPFALSGEKK